MRADLSKNEQAEPLSPAWFAVKLVDLEREARTLLLRHNVPLSELPAGEKLERNLRDRADYLRDKLLRERPDDRRVKWLRSAAWFTDVRRAGNQMQLAYFT